VFWSCAPLGGSGAGPGEPDRIGEHTDYNDGFVLPMAIERHIIIVADSNTRHKLAESEYAKRRSQCEAAARALQVAALRNATPEALDAAQKQMEPVVFRRARHVITENDRTFRMARAMQASDWLAVGQLIVEKAAAHPQITRIKRMETSGPVLASLR